MEDIKALFYLEVGHLAVYLQGKMTFRETGLKTSMSWPLILLFVDTYEDYYGFMTPELKKAAEKIKQAMLTERGMKYNEFRIRSYRYMNLFGTWGPKKWDYFGGMFATYWKEGDRYGLKDIVFGDKPTEAILDLSRQEFYHFVSNWLVAHNWKFFEEINLEGFLNAESGDVRIPELKDKSQYRSHEIHLREYLLHYLFYLRDMLLTDQMSLEYLLSLNGIHTVGGLLCSEKVRQKHGDFFRNLLDSRERLPRGWQAVLAIIMENAFDSSRFCYNRVINPYFLKTEPYDEWVKGLETNEFGIEFRLVEQFNDTSANADPQPQAFRIITEYGESKVPERLDELMNPSDIEIVELMLAEYNILFGSQNLSSKRFWPSVDDDGNCVISLASQLGMWSAALQRVDFRINSSSRRIVEVVIMANHLSKYLFEFPFAESMLIYCPNMDVLPTVLNNSTKYLQLYVNQTFPFLRGIERLRGLEMITISNGGDCDEVHQIQNMIRRNPPFSPVNLKELSNLWRIQADALELDTKYLPVSLKHLFISICRFRISPGIQLPHLERLRVAHSIILDGESIHEFAPNLELIEIVAPINSAEPLLRGIEHLKKLKQLVLDCVDLERVPMVHPSVKLYLFECEFEDSSGIGTAQVQTKGSKRESYEKRQAKLQQLMEEYGTDPSIVPDIE